MGMKQHEPIRVPQGWTGQNRALIIQLERLFDDLYKRFGNLTRADLGKELNAFLNSLASSEDVTEIRNKIGSTPMGTTANTITGAVREHETDITELSGEVSALYGLTVTQLKGK